MSYNPYYTPTPPHAYMTYTPANWNASATPPTSAPPTSGGANSIQFGSLHPGQVEALQYSAQHMYAYSPYPVHMMPQPYYPAPPHMPTAPTHGSQPPHGVPPQREGRGGTGGGGGGGGGPRNYDSRQRVGRPGQHQHRERNNSNNTSSSNNDQKEGGGVGGGSGGGGHRETSHHKPMREASHGHASSQISRSATPTSQQPQHRETTPSVHHPPPMSAGYPSQSMPMTMAMHHPHYAAPPMHYYYGAPYPHGYPMPTPGDAPVPDAPQGYHQKSNPRYHLEPSSAPMTHGPTHSVPMSESVESSQRPTPTATTSKKRLPFVNPNTQTPLEHFPSPSTTQVEKTTPPLTESVSHSSSRPSSPRTKTAIDKTVSDVISFARIERSSSKVVTSKVQKTELKTGESASIKSTARAPLPFTCPPRKIIDPSNVVGTHTLGSFKPSAVKNASELPANPSKIKETSNVAADVLRTVESVERKLEAKPSPSLQQQSQPPVAAVLPTERKEAVEPAEVATPEEKPKVGRLILDASARKSATKPSDVIADVVPGTQVVAERIEVRVPAKETEEEEEAKLAPAPPPPPQPQPSPVVVAHPVSVSKSEVTHERKPEEPKIEEQTKSEEKTEKTELAAIETKREVVPEPKAADTPSKSHFRQVLMQCEIHDLLLFRNVYSPSVLFEFKDKNKEPLPDMGSGPWLEGASELDSPSRETLPRRNSSGKMGSRSNSYQGLSRRNSNNGRASRQAKSDAEDVFHTSTKQRIYSEDFMLNMKAQFTEKPPFQESMQCMKDYEGGIRRSGSDRWNKPGRSGFDDRGKQSLNRSGSGRDWQKDASSRSGNVVVSGRRMTRQFSGQTRGADDSKWGKTDISMLSPFAPTSAPGVGLHHADNRYVVGETQTDDPEEEKRQKIFKGLLNKLTPSNFARMYEKFKEVEIMDPKTLKGLIDQIFDKALTETTFCPLYSDLCKLLTSEMPEFEEEGDKRKLTFRRLLLNKCQNEFEKGDAAVRAAEEAEKADDATMSAEERQSRLMIAKKERLRSLGNMQFIGFLFKKGMLTERIIHNCIVDLLSEEIKPKPEDIECLCQLLTTVGALLTTQKEVLDAYFCRIGRLTKHPNLETRHKFMLLDLIELKDRHWVERREKEGPKKIEEIHRDAQIEQMAQNSRNRGGGFRGDYGGRSSRGAGWSRVSSSTSRPMTSFNSHEEVKPLTKNLSLGRTASSDISLRPSNIGAPKSAVVSMPRPRSPSSSHPPPPQQAPPIDESVAEAPRPTTMDADVLKRKVKNFLAEYYNNKDLEEALSCIEELFEQNAPKPEILLNILLCALDIRGVDVNERLRPITPILKELLSRKLFAPPDAKRGLQLTMAALPDAADEFPKAPVLIAKMLGSLVSEGIIPLKPILDTNGIILGAGRENLQSEDDDTPLVECGMASEILIEILKQMKSEEQEEAWVRDALHNENADLTLFYPFCQRDDTDMSEELQFLD